MDLPLPPTVARGNAVFPEGGRLAFLVAGATRDLVDELRALELLADNVRALFALTGICLALRLPLDNPTFYSGYWVYTRRWRGSNWGRGGNR